MLKEEAILLKVYIIGIILLIVVCCLAACTTQRKMTSTITLNGSKSFDPDGWIVTYKWQQVSGNNTQLLNSDSVIAKAIISSRGVYVFQLVGIDNEGALGYKRVTKTIK